MKTLADAIAELLKMDPEAYACREGDIKKTNEDDIANCRLYVDPKEPSPDHRWLVRADGDPFNFHTADITATDWVVIDAAVSK